MVPGFRNEIGVPVGSLINPLNLRAKWDGPSYVMLGGEKKSTARFARVAEIAEIKAFSFAVERTAKEKHSAAKLQKLTI